jgi:hypothetical protein
MNAGQRATKRLRRPNGFVAAHHVSKVTGTDGRIAEARLVLE